MAEGIIHDTETKMEEFKDQLPADEVSPLLNSSISLGCIVTNVSDSHFSLDLDSNFLKVSF